MTKATPKSFEQILTETESLLAKVKPREAEALLESVLEVANEAELRRWEVDLRKTISGFLPKRRRALEALLDGRLAPPTPLSAPRSPSSPNGPSSSAVDISGLKRHLTDALRDLSEYHIFQWTTFYRDNLFPSFKEFVNAFGNPGSSRNVEETFADAIREHASEIFRKGLRYTIDASPVGSQRAVPKALGGLQGFLELPIEFYSAELRGRSDYSTALALRAVASAFLRGVLEGFGATHFPRASGWQLLSQHSGIWFHYLGFMTRRDCETIVARLDTNPLTASLDRLMLPLLEVIDGFTGRKHDYHPMPVMGQFFAEQGRLEIALLPPPQADLPQNIDIICYLDGTAVSQSALREATNRHAALVLAEIRSELQSTIDAHDTLNQVCATVKLGDRTPVDERRVRHILELEIYRRSSPRAAAAPISYNFAKDFPLHNPFLTQYFRVRRPSVRNLLRTFEKRNGVRLWCSVRRSGKTTACFDLGTTSDGDIVVSQTCDSTEQTPGANTFYAAVRQALGEGKDLKSDFVPRTVSECIGTDLAQRRCVFVLDEYETLFGALDTAVSRSPAIRYAVAQPLLNQLVALSRDNLVVLLGQQPDAHYILMDQNQLSAYVEQDSFPLFTHEYGSLYGELPELVEKVLTDRVAVEPGFLDGVFDQAGGHPYLTVKLLIDVVDWLIQQQRPGRNLYLGRSDIEQFCQERLSITAIARNKEYEFFRQAAAEATGRLGRERTPWLHAVYGLVRGVAVAAPDSLAVPMSDVEAMCEAMRFEELGFSVDHLVSTASHANFLRLDQGMVKPTVPLLARIAAGTRGRVQ